MLGGSRSIWFVVSGWIFISFSAACSRQSAFSLAGLNAEQGLITSGGDGGSIAGPISSGTTDTGSVAPPSTGSGGGSTAPASASPDATAGGTGTSAGTSGSGSGGTATASPSAAPTTVASSGDTSSTGTSSGGTSTGSTGDTGSIAGLGTTTGT